MKKNKINKSHELRIEPCDVLDCVGNVQNKH